MTLNLTLLTSDAIYQSADFQLTDADTGQPLQTDSMKIVTVHYPTWEGFVTYTGVGRWQRRDTAEWVVEWLTGLTDASPDEVTERVRDRGTQFIRAIERSPHGRRHKHTFVFAAFLNDAPVVATISNFEDCSGRSDHTPSEELRVDSRRMRRRRMIVVTGQKPAVRRSSRRRLERLAERADASPGRIRNELTAMNAEAANSREAAGTVSVGCSVVSFRRDGSGFQDLTEGSSAYPRSLMNGQPLPDIAALVGVDPGFVRGISFGRSSPGTQPQPHPPCTPQVVTPAEAGEYELVELTHPEFESATAHDVSDATGVLGSGARAGQPGTQLICLWDSSQRAELAGFSGNAGPRGLNGLGQVGATADMSDGSVHATRWCSGEPPEDLGTIHGTESEEFADSGATAINDLSLVVGWVSVSTSRDDRGQGNYRPAAWIPGEGLIHLTDFALAWGQAVDVNDAGTVLIVAHTAGIRGIAKALRWNPVDGTHLPIGSDDPDGVYPMGLTADGIILGNASNASGQRIACVSSQGGPWERLGTPDGWYATAINDSGDVTGSFNSGGFDRPWLRRSSGEVLWLPFFDHHYCRPNGLANNGCVVGTAQTDHGTHALLWRFKQVADRTQA